jgi:class 3 adenylate cyclase
MDIAACLRADASALSIALPAVADIAGFTRLAGCITPVDTMQLLDRLFMRFDTLATSHGVYSACPRNGFCGSLACADLRALSILQLAEVETVGDSYVAVSGMLPARADHGRAALRFALDLHAAAAATEVPASAGGGHLHIRVGLHSGPISAWPPKIDIAAGLRVLTCAQ